MNLYDPWDEDHFESDFSTLWLIPHGKLTPAEQWSRAQEARVWCSHAGGFEHGDGDLPAKFTPLRLESDHIRVTAFYREIGDYAGRLTENYAGNGIEYPFIVRLVELEGKDGEVELIIAGPVARAFKTNLLGQIENELTPEDASPDSLYALPEELAPFGIVPQLPGMYRDMTAREWLLFVRALYDRGQPEEVAAMLGLTEFLGRRMADLSGGVQRRLSLAAALLPEPELLLLDEPTVGLDPVAAREVRGWLHQAMQGRTVLMCTHNLAEAEELCQEVIILRGGRVLLDAPIAKLRERTAPRLALACLQGAAALSTALRALGHCDFQVVDAEVLISLPADASAERAAPDLLRALLAAGIDVHSCRLVRPSLEDLFLDVLKTGGTAEDSHVALPA